MFKRINDLLGDVSNILITIYQKTLSPDKGIFSPWLKGRVCSHEPHCSAYGKECFKRYGFWPGFAYTTQRVISCKPRMQKIHDPSHYRVVFFSGSPVGVPFLQGLVQDPRFEVVGVVTMPEKASGRGQQVQENIIKETARELGISTILTPNKINPNKSDEGKAFAARLQELQADYFVVVAYGKIMPVSILDIPHFCCINVHGSILPEYRGASPLQEVFLDNKSQTGLTIMKMNEKMDEGDIISTYKFPLPFSWTAKDLFAKVKTIGPAFLANSIWDLGKGHIDATAQDGSKATYCHKIEKDHGYINLRETPLKEVYNKYRAYALWPKIWSTGPDNFAKIAGKTLIIEELVCDETLFAGHVHESVYNEIGILNPAITHFSIKPEGKKAMDRESFKNGYLVS